MKILGISCYYHDSAAALIDNGKIIAAAEEERFSRIKHDSDFPKLAIGFCLEQAGINSKDLNYVVFYEKPYIKFERILLQSRGLRLAGDVSAALPDELINRRHRILMLFVNLVLRGSPRMGGTEQSVK